jgi:hypothetical protein
VTPDEFRASGDAESVRQVLAGVTGVPPGSITVSLAPADEAIAGSTGRRRKLLQQQVRHNGPVGLLSMHHLGLTSGHHQPLIHSSLVGHCHCLLPVVQLLVMNALFQCSLIQLEPHLLRRHNLQMLRLTAAARVLSLFICCVHCPSRLLRQQDSPALQSH